MQLCTVVGVKVFTRMPTQSAKLVYGKKCVEMEPRNQFHRLPPPEILGNFNLSTSWEFSVKSALQFLESCLIDEVAACTPIMVPNAAKIPNSEMSVVRFSDIKISALSCSERHSLNPVPWHFDSPIPSGLDITSVMACTRRLYAASKNPCRSMDREMRALIRSSSCSRY